MSPRSRLEVPASSFAASSRAPSRVCSPCVDTRAANSTSLSLARNLAENALYYDDPNRINTRWDRLAKFNAADVQRIAKAYLTPENRTVVVSHPKAAAGRGGAQ